MRSHVPVGNSRLIGGVLFLTVLLIASTPRLEAAGPFDTFTVPPCRVLDTRLSNPLGPIPANGSRNIAVAGNISAFNQGGAADCGVPFNPTTPALSAKGAYINVVAVNAGGPGHLTVYPFPSALPLASTLNFTTGQTIANGVLVPICDPGVSACMFDLTITMGPAAAHIVIDVTDYLQSP